MSRLEMIFQPTIISVYLSIVYCFKYIIDLSILYTINVTLSINHFARLL